MEEIGGERLGFLYDAGATLMHEIFKNKKKSVYV